MHSWSVLTTVMMKSKKLHHPPRTIASVPLGERDDYGKILARRVALVQCSLLLSAPWRTGVWHKTDCGVGLFKTVLVSREDEGDHFQCLLRFLSLQ